MTHPRPPMNLVIQYLHFNSCIEFTSTAFYSNVFHSLPLHLRKFSLPGISLWLIRMFHLYPPHSSTDPFKQPIINRVHLVPLISVLFFWGYNSPYFVHSIHNQYSIIIFLEDGLEYHCIFCCVCVCEWLCVCVCVHAHTWERSMI